MEITEVACDWRHSLRLCAATPSDQLFDDLVGATSSHATKADTQSPQRGHPNLRHQRVPTAFEIAVSATSEACSISNTRATLPWLAA